MIGEQVEQLLTDRMVEQGIAECAEAHFSGDVHQVRQALAKGQCDHCRCIFDSLARQIGAHLGQVDNQVRAVFQYEAMLAPDSAQPGDENGPRTHPGLHLIIWVERKSAALSTLAEAIKAALSGSLDAMLCPTAAPECVAVDLEMVDDRDIQASRGFGLLAKSPLLKSHRVWDRSGEAETPPRPVPEKPDLTRFALPEVFDPEFMPEGRLIEHALSIERLSPADRATLEHHLTQLKVTLIRRIISDQLRYINIAKQWFSVPDLADIHRRRLGPGRIGGKSAGMLLAARILNNVADEALKGCIHIPESFFLGSDLMTIFVAMNGLMHWNDQKYKPEGQIRDEYATIREEFLAGEFPPEILSQLQEMLGQIGPRPLIVRSSSQLEDNLGTSFAGKYDSYFCPNQGTLEENLHDLTRAIAATYASTFKPDALLYRRSRGLQDYDERMAVLIQELQGEKWKSYYLPFVAGVAFSRNLYRWAPQIRREDGFARLVWGLGTRAVERVGNDYARLVALSHPSLQPDDNPEAIRYYSQRYVDLIDLQANAFRTLPVQEVLAAGYPEIRFLVQIEQDGYLVTPRSRILEADVPRLAVTFDYLLQRTPFPARLAELLRLLEQHLLSPVDVEFTVHVPEPGALSPEVHISLLQCRPQASLRSTQQVSLPENPDPEDIVFASRFVVPQGCLKGIRHVIFVPPEAYYALPSVEARHELGRLIGRLNAALEPKTFICVGPGRWGTTNPDLGVLVGYSDICNAGAMVELSGADFGPAPEPSLGTHFFQDLMEASIYPVAINLDRSDSQFNRAFFYETPSSLLDYTAASPEEAASLRLIEVEKFRPGWRLELIMDDEKGFAAAILADS
jgi:hypothetical protein